MINKAKKDEGAGVEHLIQVFVVLNTSNLPRVACKS